MKKTKIKNLFNKNHITITKKENCSNDTISCSIRLVEKDTDDYSYYSIRKRNQIKRILKKMIKYMKEFIVCNIGIVFYL